MKKALFSIGIFCVFIFIISNLTNPEICVNSVFSSLVLCGNVIIPSLFPFTVCVLFILRSSILEKLKFLNKFTGKLFGHNHQMFSVFLLSMVGGYPVGAKLLNESGLEKNKKIMINYCVNAGPAFIILAVGNGILNSIKLGYVLFSSHIFSSIILALFYKNSTKAEEYSHQKQKINIIDSFVQSVSDSANTVFSICSFIILFSVITGYINFYSKKYHFLKYLTYFLEVTNAVSQAKNIFLISFLLGFGGICVWFQIFSLANNFKINLPQFILSRIIHGILSSALTLLFLKIFKISVGTFSNNKSFLFLPYSNLSVAISLLIMGIILIISLYSKKITGNILEDLV